MTNAIDINKHTSDKVSEKNWYAIRVTYNRELKVKEDLESRGMEYFLPMHYIEKIKGERKFKILTPAIHNLIFIHCSQDEMKTYKAETALPIRYIMNNETHRPVIVPERQMKSFIAVAGNYDEQIIYLDYDTTTLRKGEKVRITGGVFEGAIGEFLRLKGDRRVVVTIPGVAAVATAFIHPSLIQKFED